MKRALLAGLFFSCMVIGCGDKAAQSSTEASSPALFMRRGSLEDRFFLSGELEAENAELLQVPRIAQGFAELNALIQHEKAVSDLQLATGDLIEARNLAFSL